MLLTLPDEARRSKAVCLSALVFPPLHISPRLDLRTVFALEPDGGSFVIILFYSGSSFVPVGYDVYVFRVDVWTGLPFIFICRQHHYRTEEIINISIIFVTQTRGSVYDTLVLGLA